MSPEDHDDVVPVIVKDGQARMIGGDQLPLERSDIFVDLDHFDFGAWCHHGADTAVAKPDDTRDHRAFGFFDHSSIPGLGYDCKVSSSVIALSEAVEIPNSLNTPLVDASSSQTAGAAILERMFIGFATAQAIRSGFFNARCFWNEFADDDRQERDDANHQDIAEHIGNVGAPSGSEKVLAHSGAKRCPRIGTRNDADQSDADLDRRKEFPRVLRQGDCRVRARNAAVGQHFKTAPPKIQPRVQKAQTRH